MSNVNAAIKSRTVDKIALTFQKLKFKDFNIRYRMTIPNIEIAAEHHGSHHAASTKPKRNVSPPWLRVS